jgi:hypothetical protein
VCTAIHVEGPENFRCQFRCRSLFRAKIPLPADTVLSPQGNDFKRVSMLKARLLDSQTDFFPALREE